MPDWLAWPVAIAFTGGVLALVLYWNRAVWKLSWRAAIYATLAVIVLQLVIQAARR